MKFTTKNQKANFIAGLNWLLLVLERSVKGKINNINNDPNIATTPNNLFGILLNIAQNGNKYHSGTIEAGVTIGLAGI